MKTLATILIGLALVISFSLYYEKEEAVIPQSTPVGATTEQLLAEEIPRFAEIDPQTGEVLRVILIDQANINTGKWGNPDNWIRTSDKGTIRKNHASKGYVYDKNRDAFIPPKPRVDATLNKNTARWEIPALEESIVATSTDI